MYSLLQQLPEFIKKPARTMYRQARAFRYVGTGRWCPVCGRSFRAFAPAGRPERQEALCVYCNSLERHRFAWLYLKNHTNLFDGTPKQMLHVAPESGFQQPLQQALGDGYVSADFARSDVKVKVDITDMQFADNSFDVICCSHVLEHVSDDRKAMREFRRVLKPEGWALIMVPIFAEVSFEDPAVVDPAERLRLYGQEDHVRAYGADFVNRLRESGLHVDVFDPPDLYSVSEIKRMGLGQAGTIFRCQPK